MIQRTATTDQPQGSIQGLYVHEPGNSHRELSKDLSDECVEVEDILEGIHIIRSTIK